MGNWVGLAGDGRRLEFWQRRGQFAAFESAKIRLWKGFGHYKALGFEKAESSKELPTTVGHLSGS